MKAIIFDMDDTLTDNFGTVKIPGITQAIKQMQKHGFEGDLESTETLLIELINEDPQGNPFQEMVRQDLLTEKQAKIGKHALDFDSPFDKLQLFPGVENVLTKLKERYKLFLATTGKPERQKEKVAHLGIEEFFEEVCFDHQLKENITKKDLFEEIIEKHDIRPTDIVVVGDRIDREIKFANELGMHTVQVLHGNYAKLAASDTMELPDRKILNIVDLPGAIAELEAENE